MDRKGSIANQPARRASVSHGLAFQENIKEKQQKYKEEREARKDRITPPIKHMIETVSMYSELDKEAITNFILDTEQQIAILENFCSKGGIRCLMFYIQEGDIPKIESGRNFPKMESGKVLKAIVTTGESIKLVGKAVFFSKPRGDIALTVRNISEETCFGSLDPSMDGSVLLSFANLLGKVFLPALKATESWGKLKETNEGRNQRLTFIANFENTVNYFDSAHRHTRSMVELAEGPGQDILDNLEGPIKQREFSQRPEQLKILEELVTEKWCKQMEQVLAESEQMRKEADDTGPIAELEHWRNLSAKFNFILEEIKSQRCRRVVQTLAFGKSKVLRSWLDFEGRITDYANEAKDNVKFLNSLEHVCMPLYSPDPALMMECIPNLVNVVTNIHSISRYYNTSQRMTSLYIKVTNQVVASCKNYLTDNGDVSIWEQETAVILEKIQQVEKLYQCYVSNFQQTKQKLQSVSENNGNGEFECSEMYIFGKLESFCKRLQKITELIKTMKTYNSINESKIEGIENIASKFTQIVQSTKKKPYDILDPRKTDFDKDFIGFTESILNIEDAILDFMDKCFDKVKTSDMAVTLIRRFEKLKLPFLQQYIEEKYERVVEHYWREMDYVQKLYLKQKDNPPKPKDTPEVTGRLCWVRQLLRRIQLPIFTLKDEVPDLLESKIGKEIVKKYNRLAMILVEYEEIYYKKWENLVDEVQLGLNATLLVRHPTTQRLYVNWDPKISEIARDVDIIERLKLDIPKLARDVQRKIKPLKATKDRLTSIIERYENLKITVPQIFQDVVQPHINKVNTCLREGVIYVLWSSLNHQIFFKNVETAMAQLELVVKKVSDIKDARIDAELKKMSEEFLLDLPEEPTDLETFVDDTKKICDTAGASLARSSEKIRVAVLELIKYFAQENQMMDKLNLGTIDEECDSFRQMIDDIFNHFRERQRDALCKCIKYNIDILRKRVFYRGSKSNEASTPLFKATIALVIPNVVLQPNLDDIQGTLTNVCRELIDVSKLVPKWQKPAWAELKSPNPSKVSVFNGPDNAESVQGEFESYHKNISENKDIVKLVMMVTSAVNSVREPIANYLEQFNTFGDLWLEDRDEEVKKFEATEPHLTDWKQYVMKYDQVSENIDELPDKEHIGPVDLRSDSVKESLQVEARNWKVCLCRAMNTEYHQKMKDLLEFMDVNDKALSRNIKDLDDIRFTMDSLSQVRECTPDMDQKLNPIEEAYALLNKFEIKVDSEEANAVDTLRYNWKKLLEKEAIMQQTLLEAQEPYHKELVEKIADFQDASAEFDDAYNNEGPMAEGITPQEASDRLAIFQTKFEDLWRKFQTYNSGEQLFGLTKTDYPNLHKVKKELMLLQKLYGLYNAVMDSVNGYYDLLWTEVDIEAINNELIDFQNKCKKLPKALKDWQAYRDLQGRVDDFSECCPILELMSDKSMQQRHWDRIESTTGVKFDVYNENFQLRNIMEAPILENKEDLEDICISAVKEKDIESKLRQLVNDWAGYELYFAEFKSRGKLLLKGTETTETIAIMEDSLMLLSSLMSNRYNVPFKKEIQSWVQKLSNTTDIIEQWLVVQNLWVYLEAVFVGGDIAKQLPQEAKRFANIDKTWVKIMSRAVETPNVVQCCVGDETMSQLLPHLLEQLELCQKSLTGYLEQKRLVFPRFFFISDPALLEILGQASDSHTIQSHLLGIFENVASVTFHEKNYNQIIAYASREGETVAFDSPVMAQGNVEIWLGDLLSNQQKALHGVIRNAFFSVSDPATFNLLDFQYSQPAQVGLLGIQMLWTMQAEEALVNAKTDKKIMATTNQRFGNILQTLIDQTATELTKFDRVKFETLVTIHVHQRDIFDDLVRMHIKTPQDFEWLKQARFYFDQDEDKCIVSITDVNFIYQNEFLGCTERLVITPLTDRCYITLAQALGMSMGGAPAGPAGTGKTETTKDMAKALGKYCVVFNCSDQMDFRGLGRIYKGLAQSGSWGCFDEFNRIELPVLSVAAQQIHIILTARKEKKTSFIFSDGDHVSLNSEFGLFITMNPGYAGRQELPENLKVQFRSVAMMVPDRQIIKRVKLAACGFRENQILAAKFFTLYKLCEEQLTKQVHYDFGLRNILSCLRTLGAVKRSRPDDSEATIVMRVLRDMNLSKLVDEDEPLFMSLIGDLFPGITLDIVSYDDLQSAMSIHIAKANLINYPSWNLKVVQLFETQNVRHGIMTLGPTGAGKTCCIRTLMRAMTELGNPHKELRMNPKAITAPQMFGRLDVATNDWTDGIFSTLWRRTHKTKKGENVWLILDGPVDAIWIENLNSVLDDNKTLTLANGDRIPMAPNCKILFEVHNIDNASPATVSRNGMIFMSSSVLNWDPLLEGWLLSRSVSEQNVIRPLVTCFFLKCYEYVCNNLNPKMLLLECMYIRQLCDILDGLLPAEGEDAIDENQVAKYVVFALMWSVGSVLELDERLKLQEIIIEINKTAETKFNLPTLSGEETIFEYRVGKDTGEWEHWEKSVVPYEYPSDGTPPTYADILIPNVDNVRTNFLITTIAKQEKQVLLIGEQGTAKTVMIKGYMNQYDPELYVTKALNFSSATEPIMFQRAIESFVDKRMGSTYGPPAGRKMTVFIDDINMPIVNNWGDQITNEIVRQMIEYKGMFSLEKPGDFTTIVDVQFIGAMIHPGGGRNDIPERLKRQFSVFNCTLPSNASIDKIFGTLATHYSLERGFSQDVIDTVKLLVPASRILWQQTKVKMLPTPAKFHYIFNLRDLSRVWEGMLRIGATECSDVETVICLWTHEIQRVISDRFTNADDVAWFNKALVEVVKTNLGESYAEKIDLECVFVDFLRDAPEPTGEEEEDVDLEAPKILEKAPDLDIVKEKLHFYMDMLNEQTRGSPMDLVFFKDAIRHLCKISRIIRTSRGAAMLVGVGGSGKQSLTKLASFIAGYKVFQITLTRTYNAQNLLEDLKYLYKQAGEVGQGMTFIFTDNEIKDEGFLEYLNNLLSSGEISGLFARDEIDEITQNLIPVMKAEFPKVPPTAENLYNYFIARARDKLHVVLCFSPVSQQFRTRALKFPGLFSGCTMDWFSKWPEDALVAVADHFLGKYKMSCTPEIKEALIKTMGTIHHTVGLTCVEYFERYRRTAHVTPKSYLSFLEGFRNIYKQRYELLGDLESRMNVGLEKLLEAGESVEQLKRELVVKEKELEIASAEADVVLAEVTVSSEAAQKVKAEVLKVKEKAQKLVDEINAEKAIAESKLAAAGPALQEAEDALNTIKAADISTVRKLAKPPHLIMRIMDCVLILFQMKLDPVTPDPDKPYNKPSWGQALKLMSSPSFLKDLQTFNKDTITEEVVELLKDNYFSHEDYNFETAKKVSGNVAGLLSWTKAMVSFYSVNKEVLPLKANLAKQAAKLEIAQAELATAQAELDAKQAELDIVQAKFDAAMKMKNDLMEDAESCQRRAFAAKALIEGLGGEKIRWTAQSKMFADQIRRLVGDVILATGFLSYCGPFNQEFRNKLIKEEWLNLLVEQGIPFTDDLDVINMLTDSAQIGEWNLEGLPTDDLSIQNAIIVTKAQRFPLLIDPQGQAKNWINNKEGERGLVKTSLNNKYFRQHLEDALSLGNPLLIEDVAEELDPALDNVLEKNFIKSGSTFKVKVGDKECDVMDGFQLYITTKLPNPKYTPEVSARTSIIDFTVTAKGLEDQLLGRVILYEKQELEAERVKLVTEVTANKRKMKQLEDNLLYKLTSTKGSLVDDESLIVMLANTKETAAEVSEKLAVADDTNIKINLAREEFRPVAERGSILYFVICDLAMVNCMYQISLNQFLQKFDEGLENSKRSPITAKRIGNINETLTEIAFKYTCRGLYENDKLLFTLLMTLKIDIRKGNVKHQEFQTFIKGGAALDLKSCPSKPANWILDMTWLNLVQLQKLPEFREILNQISRNEKQWKQWFDSEAPEEEPIPDGYSASLDTFRKLLLIRCWCPDRTMPQARKYIADSMGTIYAEAVILDLDKMYAESDIKTPMIGLLSMGSDPTNQIMEFGKKKGIECRAISMGQGQEIHARRLISMSMQNGGWVLLQNCHLGLGFMDEMLETLLTQDEKQTNPTFRIWITTEVHPQFSITTLQSSIKFTNEPPQGVKAGLKRTYAGYSQDVLEISNEPSWKPLLYTVAFLHTTVQERRKFGPLGWNIPYEFNSADQTATVQFIQNHLDDLDPKRGIQWQTVRYMIGEVQYGGRVTDDFDKRLLNTFAKVWFSEETFSEKFVFGKGYGVPKYSKIDEIMTIIEGMPLVDSPEVYGLHSNADITFQTNTAKSILDTIVNIQPKDSGGGAGETRESVVYRQADEMLEKCPDDYVAHQVKARLVKMGKTNSMNIFLGQEIDRMQKVISLVKSTLSDLKLAIDGTIIMSENLTDALDNIFDARVPTNWRKISWASSTLGFWFTELIERCTQLTSWVFSGRPQVFWMTGFFNPQGFLTAMRQEVTRMHKGWALDSVLLHNEVLTKFKEDISASPAEGVYVHGLYLDGAGWERKSCKLQESQPKVLFVPLPVVHIYAINTMMVNPNTLRKDQYQCPVYKKPCRTDLTFITSLYLKSGAFKDTFWTMRGVALLCDIK